MQLLDTKERQVPINPPGKGQAPPPQACPLSIFLYFRSNSLEKITLKTAKESTLTFCGAPPNQAVINWFANYFQRIETPFPLSLQLEVPSFTLKVLEELQKIPFGQTASYGEIAARLGSPGAARAVGNACNRNPFPLIIPCHRVISTGGGIGGFEYGCEMKKALLNFESV